MGREKKKKKPDAVTAKAVNGFVSIECRGCGLVTTTCLHEKRTIFNCKVCGHPTPLAGVTNLHFKCSCGFHAAYRTNRRDSVLTMDCLNCKEPVEQVRIWRGNYVPRVEVEV